MLFFPSNISSPIAETDHKNGVCSTLRNSLNERRQTRDVIALIGTSAILNALSILPISGLIQQQTLVERLPIEQIIEPISLGLELVGVAIIVYGALVSLAFLIQVESRDRKQAGLNQHSVKQQFTSRILTGLEFFIAGDVLKTILNPTLQSLEVVAVIVAIRAALTFLLNRELRQEEAVRRASQRGLDAAEGRSNSEKSPRHADDINPKSGADTEA